MEIQLTPLSNAPATGEGPTVVPVLEGDLARLPQGKMVRAVVQQISAGQALLDAVGTARLVIPASARLQVGQELAIRARGQGAQAMLELIPLESQPGRSSRAAQLLRSAAGTVTAQEPVAVSIQPGQPVLSLTPGQELTVQVLRELPQGRALVQAGGLPFEAITGQAFTPGVELDVQVQQVRPDVVLRVLDQRAGPVQLALQVLRQTPPRPALAEVVQGVLSNHHSPSLPGSGGIEALQQRLRQLLPEGIPNAERLTNFVRDGGMQYEAKLARLAQGPADQILREASTDIKGLLLRATTEALSAPGQAEGSLRPMLQHLQAVEVQQATNLLALMRGDPVQVQVPLLIGGGVSTLSFSVSPDGEGGEAGQQRSGGHNLMMHVDLDRLGEVRIDAHLTPTSLRAIFYMDKSEGRARVQAALPAFRQALGDLGYHDVLLGVRAAQELPIRKQEEFAALQHGAPTSGPLLDVRV